VFLACRFAFLILVALMMIPHGAKALDASQGSGRPCSIEVPSGSSVIAQDTVRFPDGTTHVYSPQVCDSVNVPTINGWIESNSYTNTGGFNSISGQWNVPNGPSNTNDPLIYLFNSLQGTYNNSPYIIQPVLTWGCAYYFFVCTLGGHYWWIASWLVFTCGGCASYHSSPVNANSGDLISGSVTWLSSGCNGDGTGGSGYLINVQDVTTSGNGYLYFCTGTKSVTANSAVLEAYRINSCNQLPNQSSETFSSTSVDPSVSVWQLQKTGDSPQCGYDFPKPPATNIHVNSYPTTDTYSRSHGLSYSQPLPNPWWPPYQSGYEFKVTGSAFDYYTSKTFSIQGSNYVQEAASGFIPSYAWHTKIYINNALTAEGDVARDHPLQANFNVFLTPTCILTWNPSG
jgi:hypothetical protein